MLTGARLIWHKLKENSSCASTQTQSWLQRGWANQIRVGLVVLSTATSTNLGPSKYSIDFSLCRWWKCEKKTGTDYCTTTEFAPLTRIVRPAKIDVLVVIGDTVYRKKQKVLSRANLLANISVNNNRFKDEEDHNNLFNHNNINTQTLLKELSHKLPKKIQVKLDTDLKGFVEKCSRFRRSKLAKQQELFVVMYHVLMTD